MRASLFTAAILFSSFFSVSIAQAEGSCPADWTVKAEKQGSYLNVSIREVSTQGPACDLVVTSFSYIEGLKGLSLTVSPVKFCPLDAVAHRSANLRWQLPQEVRGAASLRLFVNGADLGRLVVSQGLVTVEGGCR